MREMSAAVVMAGESKIVMLGFGSLQFPLFWSSRVSGAAAAAAPARRSLFELDGRGAGTAA
jgi:hypothetical protein